MAKNVKIHLKRNALKTIRKSPAVQADMLARAQRIAAAAGPGMEASSMVGITRSRASVVTATPEARRAEATRRSLSMAIRAGA